IMKPPNPKHHDLFDCLRQKTVEIVADHPLTKTEIIKCLKQRYRSECSDDIITGMINKIIHQLVSKKQLFILPPFGHQKQVRYSTIPPNPNIYLKKIETELTRIIQKLHDSGISSHAIMNSLSDMILKKPQKSCRSNPLNGLEELDHEMIKHILMVEPAARQQVLVSIPDIRSSMNIPDPIFDQTLFHLAKNEKIFLHRHVHPSQMEESERKQMLSDDMGNVFIGLVLRKN
ncbi:MAG: hypothetical protein HQK77_18115, partial [Desulfobacterales bacterium]|nr:hypothetical protein [Desulfobacterales bacterium]